MTPQVARGFIATVLSPEQMETAIDYEKQFPPRRYLQPFELAAKLKIKIDRHLEDFQIESMNQTWIDFCRSTNRDQMESIGEHDVAEEWTRYAAKHYHEPMPPVQKSWSE